MVKKIVIGLLVGWLAVLTFLAVKKTPFGARTSDTTHGTLTQEGDINPSTNNTYNLGAFGSAWKNLFVSSTSYLSTVFTGNGAPSQPSLSFSGDTDTGWFRGTQGGTGFIFTVDGNSQIAVAGSSTVAFGNGTVDLGQYYVGTSNWGPFRNIYASSTVFANSVQVPISFSGPSAPSYSWAGDTDTGLYKAAQGNGFIVAIDSKNYLAFNDASGPAPSSTSPFGNSLINFGGFYNSQSGQGAWNNIYASGTLYAKESILFNPQTTSSLFINSTASSRGGTVILKDASNGNCYELYFNAGTLINGLTTCPTN